MTGSRDRTVKEWDLGRAYCEAPPCPRPHWQGSPGLSVKELMLLSGSGPQGCSLHPPSMLSAWFLGDLWLCVGGEDWGASLGWEAGGLGSRLGWMLVLREGSQQPCSEALAFASGFPGSRTINVLSYCNDVVCGDHIIISGHNDQKIRFWDSR